ncbi:DnaJ protein, putative [Plasmodium gaboni]|uniref:DnaJ protein, putative n=1 Tax=Plasmodium gaboni TaxID=647221 RepID=A0ABY1UTS5_9APIC|nr:DnaJ protein, putative [Plasmodium gaboni]
MDLSFIPKELRGKDIYKILGLHINDCNNENAKNIIRKKYLKAALILHPDKKEVHYQQKEEKKIYAENFSTLKSAYEFLLNEQLRKKYNLYLEKKGKVINNTPVNNTSLKRYLDKKKFLSFNLEKINLKKKLEEKEKIAQCLNENNIISKNKKKYIKHKNNNDTHYNNEEKHLKNIKKKNESYMKKNKSKDFCKKEKEIIHQSEKIIEIYLKNYKHNQKLLQSYIKEKKILKFFIDFNFNKYSLKHINHNKNDHVYNDDIHNDDIHNDDNVEQVGYLIFSHRFETIRAYLHYKNNINEINKNFILKLRVPCDQKKNEDEKDNIDRMMNEMVNELDKIFTT